MGWENSPDFAKYSATGTLQFKQPMQYWEARPSYSYLTEKGGDFYFVALYNSGYSLYAYPWFSPYEAPIYNGDIKDIYSVNNAKSFLSVRFNRSWYRNIEIRFGPGKGIVSTPVRQV